MVLFLLFFLFEHSNDILTKYHNASSIELLLACTLDKPRVTNDQQMQIQFQSSSEHSIVFTTLVILSSLTNSELWRFRLGVTRISVRSEVKLHLASRDHEFIFCLHFA